MVEIRKTSIPSRLAVSAGFLLGSLQAGCSSTDFAPTHTTNIQLIQAEQSPFPPLPLLDTFTEFDQATGPLRITPDLQIQERVQLTVPLIKIQSDTRSFSCSGNTITPDTMVTAAHCLDDIPPDQLHVSVLNSEQEWSRISLASTIGTTDIALLHTEQPVSQETVPIRPTGDVQIGDPLFIHAIKPNNDTIDARIIAGRYIGRAINIDIGRPEEELDNYFLVIVEPGVLETGFSGAGITDDQGRLVGILSAIGPISLNNEPFFAGLCMRSEIIQMTLSN